MKNILNKAAACFALVGGFFALLISLVTIINVTAFGVDKIARLLGATFPAIIGYEDFVSMTVSVVVLMFFPYCQIRRGHVAVDVFIKLFPGWFGRFIDIISTLFMSLLALFLGYMMIRGMIEVRNDNALSPILGWPVWPFYTPGIAALFLWAAIAANQIVEREADIGA